MNRILLIISLFFLLLTSNADANESINIEPDFTSVNNAISADDNYKISCENIYETVKNGDLRTLCNVVISELKKQLNNKLVYYNKFMFTIFAMCIVSLLTNLFSNTFESKINDRIITFFISGLLINIFLIIYDTALYTINSIITFVNSSLPVYFSVTSVMTKELPLNVYTVFILFVSLFEWLVNNLLFPIVSLMFVFTILSCIYQDFDFLSAKKFLSGVLRTILGFYTTFFVLGLKITQTITYSTQKLVLTGIQYTVSKGVPVIGGFLSETAEALFSSIILIHNSIGVSCIFIIIIMILIPFTTTFVFALILKLICAVITPFDDNNVTKLINNASDCICDIAIVLLCAGVTFIIAMSTEFITVR